MQPIKRMDGKEHIINIGYAKFWTDANDILYCQFNNDDPKSQLGKIKVEQCIDAIATLCNGNAMPFLIDLRNSRGTFTPEAASLMAQSPKLKKLKLSEVFIVDSIGIKLLIASYKRIYDPITPHCIVSSMTLAQQYCLETKSKFDTRK